MVQNHKNRAELKSIRLKVINLRREQQKVEDINFLFYEINKDRYLSKYWEFENKRKAVWKCQDI